MSLVLTAACTLFTMQVSDRLVTEIRPADRATRPFDALSNKSIIFRALNAIVSMGYVGSAYVDRKPTDEWIAEQLWGEPLTDRTPDGRIGLRFGGVRRSHDIGFAIKVLQTSLESLQPSPYGISVAITGWQAVRKKSARPIFIELEKKPNSQPVRRFDSPRWWKRNRLVVGELGGYLSPQDLESLGQKLLEVSKSKELLQDFERILAEKACQVSATNPGVGSNLMSVTIPNSKLGLAYVRFLPSSDHHVEVRIGGNATVLSASYTPWIIGPGILHPPSVIAGSCTVNLGGFQIMIHGEEPTGSIKGLHSSQRRPAAP
jgi:hypothetical protein